MKKINEQQIKDIMALLQKYNVGVAEYIAVQTMFDKLEKVEIEEVKKDEK